MELTHIRTVNGTPELITTRAALDEINAGMMDKAVRQTIRQMSAARSSANIEYRNGDKVDIRPATPEEIAEHTAAQQTGVRCMDCGNCGEMIVSQDSAEYPWQHLFGWGLTPDGSTCPQPEPKPDDLPETTTDGRRIVTVKGKRYVVSEPIYSHTATSPVSVDYWSERNGRPFGPTRWAGTEHAHKTGTVAAAIWELVRP